MRRIKRLAFAVTMLVVVGTAPTANAAALRIGLACGNRTDVVRIYTQNDGYFCFEGKPGAATVIYLGEADIIRVTGVAGGRWGGGLRITKGWGQDAIVWPYNPGTWAEPVTGPARHGDVRAITIYPR
ncbi:hypothetical protein AB0P21_39900 [Kribbella sp. NPDC056861]|uniref:hypothetical protein n=1 Tax=Kribbella sp. NPDC056861 TaxID=3154857 RepID=UPI00342D7E5D